MMKRIRVRRDLPERIKCKYTSVDSERSAAIIAHSRWATTLSAAVATAAGTAAHHGPVSCSRETCDIDHLRVYISPQHRVITNEPSLHERNEITEFGRIAYHTFEMWICRQTHFYHICDAEHGRCEYADAKACILTRDDQYVCPVSGFVLGCQRVNGFVAGVAGSADADCDGTALRGGRMQAAQVDSLTGRRARGSGAAGVVSTDYLNQFDNWDEIRITEEVLRRERQYYNGTDNERMYHIRASDSVTMSQLNTAHLRDTKSIMYRRMLWAFRVTVHLMLFSSLRLTYECSNQRGDRTAFVIRDTIQSARCAKPTPRPVMLFDALESVACSHIERPIYPIIEPYLRHKWEIKHRIGMYVALRALDVWTRIVIETPHHSSTSRPYAFQPREALIGIMYMMAHSQPVTVNGQIMTIIPIDPVLAKLMPAIGILTADGMVDMITARDVTRAQNDLLAIVRSSLENGSASHQSFCIPPADYEPIIVDNDQVSVQDIVKSQLETSTDSGLFDYLRASASGPNGQLLLG